MLSNSRETLAALIYYCVNEMEGITDFLLRINHMTLLSLSYLEANKPNLKKVDSGTVMYCSNPLPDDSICTKL